MGFSGTGAVPPHRHRHGVCCWGPGVTPPRHRQLRGDAPRRMRRRLRRAVAAATLLGALGRGLAVSPPGVWVMLMLSLLPSIGPAGSHSSGTCLSALLGYGVAAARYHPFRIPVCSRERFRLRLFGCSLSESSTVSPEEASSSASLIGDACSGMFSLSVILVAALHR